MVICSVYPSVCLSVCPSVCFLSIFNRLTFDLDLLQMFIESTFATNQGQSRQMTSSQEGIEVKGWAIGQGQGFGLGLGRGVRQRRSPARVDVVTRSVCTRSSLEDSYCSDVATAFARWRYDSRRARRPCRRSRGSGS